MLSSFFTTMRNRRLDFWIEWSSTVVLITGVLLSVIMACLAIYLHRRPDIAAAGSTNNSAIRPVQA